MPETPKSILFVDDEINILNALRRTMHPFRDRWKVKVAVGPEAALDILKTTTFDAVVADMIMPGMNGEELLRHIRDTWPETIRIMLSGQSNKESILHSVDYIHDYLPKPCDSETLIGTLNRAFSIRDGADHSRIMEVVSEMSALPTIPAIYQQLLQELESPNLEMRRVGEIISQDLAIAAKVLKLVNSAYFGLRIRVSSPVQAVKLLGINTVKAIALSVEIFTLFETDDMFQLSFDDLWQHSSLTGALSQRIAAAECDDPRAGDHALVGGLLHDVGVLILASKLPKEYQPVIQNSVEKGLPLIESEQEILGVTHAEIGAYLLKTWNLADQVVEAVTHHHSIRQASAIKGMSPAIAVHVANAMTNAQFTNWRTFGVPEPDMNYLAVGGRDRNFDRWKTFLQRMLSNSREL